MDSSKHSCTGCIFYLSFLCVLNESSNCLTFLHHDLPRVSSNCLHERIQSHTGCKCLTFLHCAFSNICSNCHLICDRLIRELRLGQCTRGLFPAVCHRIRQSPAERLQNVSSIYTLPTPSYWSGKVQSNDLTAASKSALQNVW